MPTALANALVPIFVGLLLGFLAGRRGLMDNVNVRNLIVLVMNFAVPCALFEIILGSSRAVMESQFVVALVITLVFGVLYIGSYVWARRYWTMSVSDAAVLALTIGFPNTAAVALSLLPDAFGAQATIPAALGIAVGSITISPVTLALLELASKSDEPQMSASALAKGILNSFAKPVVWSPVLALVFVFFGFDIPSYGIAVLKTLGSAADGSALLLTGVVVSAQRFHVSRPVIWTTLAKLIAQPAVAVGLAFAFGLNHSQIRDIALIGAIPGGFFGLVFGKSFDSTPEIASSGLIASYLVSVVTLPVWILILNRLA